MENHFLKPKIFNVKKLKIIVTSVIVLAIVGNAFSFNAEKRDIHYTSVDLNSTRCNTVTTIPIKRISGIQNDYYVVDWDGGTCSQTCTSGSFTINLTGLDFNTAYYIRAFATNSGGTGYGDVVKLNTTNDTSKVRFTYNGKEVIYGIIISPVTGKKWLDRNLGALQAATAYNDYKAYGDLFQWGRPADGHQLITWTSSTASTAVNGTTATSATSDNPGHSNFILGDPTTTGDWRSNNNRNRWATIPQGPCPAGWHVPTKVEWQAETATSQGGTATSGGIIDYNIGYSKLKLTAAGFRSGLGDADPAAGQLWRNGQRGLYWSSSDDFNGTNSTAVEVTIGSDYVSITTYVKSDGHSVRCIKD